MNFHNTANTWTAKLVFVAGNSWTPAQATWLDQTLSQPTTYTFVMRHESAKATTAPGVNPSMQIIRNHPFTLLIVGHQHTYLHQASDKEVIVGTGGAPLVSQTSFGYGVVERLADGTIQFSVVDYMTHHAIDKWHIHPDGSPAP